MQPNKVACANTMQALSCPALDGTGGSERGLTLPGPSKLRYPVPKAGQTVMESPGPPARYKVSSLGAFTDTQAWMSSCYILLGVMTRP
jgi:hypothetical protein